MQSTISVAAMLLGATAIILGTVGIGACKSTSELSDTRIDTKAGSTDDRLAFRVIRPPRQPSGRAGRPSRRAMIPVPETARYLIVISDPPSPTNSVLAMPGPGRNTGGCTEPVRMTSPARRDLPWVDELVGKPGERDQGAAHDVGAGAGADFLALEHGAAL